MQQASLVGTALLMGLMGGPHCVAMCGAACAGIGQAAGARHGLRAMLLFQLGRTVGYAALGGVAAASMQGAGWLGGYSAALRPVWTMLHVAAMLLGAVLLWQARQPVWLERAARRAWQQAQNARRFMPTGSDVAAPMMIGGLWALMPCGLLYAAMLVAALSGSVGAGAGVMAGFALGTSATLLVGPWLWLRLRRGQLGTGYAASGAGGIRLAGLALTLSSGWVLWSGLVDGTAPWCIPR